MVNRKNIGNPGEKTYKDKNKMNPEVKMLKDCLIQLSMFAIEAKEVLKVISDTISSSPEIKKLIENLEISIMEADECSGLPIKCEKDSCTR